MARVAMTDLDLPDGEAVISIADVAHRLGVSVGRVRTLIADRKLLAVARDGEPMIPDVFFDADGVAKHLPGLIEVMMDGGFTRDDTVRWLFAVHDDLHEYPARALHGHSAREMIRRAQSLAF